MLLEGISSWHMMVVTRQPPCIELLLCWTCVQRTWCGPSDWCSHLILTIIPQGTVLFVEMVLWGLERFYNLQKPHSCWRPGGDRNSVSLTLRPLQCEPQPGGPLSRTTVAPPRLLDHSFQGGGSGYKLQVGSLGTELCIQRLIVGEKPRRQSAASFPPCLLLL